MVITNDVWNSHNYLKGKTFPWLHLPGIQRRWSCCLSRLYKSIIPLLDYCNSIWEPNTRLKLKKKECALLRCLYGDKQLVTRCSHPKVSTQVTKSQKPLPFPEDLVLSQNTQWSIHHPVKQHHPSHPTRIQPPSTTNT